MEHGNFKKSERGNLIFTFRKKENKNREGNIAKNVFFQLVQCYIKY